MRLIYIQMPNEFDPLPIIPGVDLSILTGWKFSCIVIKSLTLLTKKRNP
jgi:hypothetical protein